MKIDIISHFLDWQKNPKKLIRCSVDKVSGEVGTVPYFWKK